MFVAKIYFQLHSNRNVTAVPVECLNVSLFCQPLPWPAPGGITQEVAVTQCRTEIEAQLNLGLCGKLDVVSAELTAAIDICVQDVQVGN